MPMKFSTWYSDNFEQKISGRYLHLEHINPLLSDYKNDFEISVIGTSEMGKDISCVKIGSGKKVILAWSQMHGNESTTTKAIFDFFKFISQNREFQKEKKTFLDNHTFYCIPILNPDGAQLYTRENANKIDLNRDAKDLSQSESRCLRALFDKIKPDLCLNLHDQRTIYSLPGGFSATVSFLAPAANEERSVTESRKIAMKLIVNMRKTLSDFIPNAIGRYDDTFNDNCVGDTFQQLGVPTILFEAGHAQEDYLREKTRAYIFYALLTALGIGDDHQVESDFDAYFSIPENEKCYKDVVIRNVKLKDRPTLVALAIQYEEKLDGNKVIFTPVLEEIGELDHLLGHKEIDAEGAEILLNSHENVFVGENVSTIINKNAKSQMIFQE